MVSIPIVLVENATARLAIAAGQRIIDDVAVIPPVHYDLVVACAEEMNSAIMGFNYVVPGGVFALSMPSTFWAELQYQELQAKLGKEASLLTFSLDVDRERLEAEDRMLLLYRRNPKNLENSHKHYTGNVVPLF